MDHPLISHNAMLAAFWIGGLIVVVYSGYVAKVEVETDDPKQCCDSHLPGKGTMPACPYLEPEPYTKNIKEWIQMRYERLAWCEKRCKHAADCPSIKEVVEYVAPEGCEDWTPEGTGFRSPDRQKWTAGEKNSHFVRIAHGSRKKQDARFFSSIARHDTASDSVRDEPETFQRKKLQKKQGKTFSA